MSRKIDALIAEHVMDRKVIKDSVKLDLSYNQGMGTKWALGDPKTLVTTEVWGLEILPHYSTNIADAWKVVEKLRSMLLGDKLGMCCFDLIWRDGESWGVNITRHFDSHQGPWVSVGLSGEDLTAPMAICKAALKSKGVDYKDNQ